MRIIENTEVLHLMGVDVAVATVETAMGVRTTFGEGMLAAFTFDKVIGVGPFGGRFQNRLVLRLASSKLVSCRRRASCCARANSCCD